MIFVSTVLKEEARARAGGDRQRRRPEEFFKGATLTYT